LFELREEQFLQLFSKLRQPFKLRLLFSLKLLYKHLTVLFFILMTATPFSPSFAIDDLSSVTNLLKQMAEANRQLSYQGIFSYEHGGALKTVKVFHSVRDGQEFERIIHLNGPEREVVRRGNNLNCQRLGDAILRGESLKGSSLRGAPSGLSELSRGYLESHYSLYMKGEDRVAGRDITVVHVVPKDEFRYGYVLGIDKETGLLLQSMLIGSKKRVLERFQFVDVTIGTLVDDMALEPTNQDHHLASLDASPCLNEKGILPVNSKRHWKVTWLPPGFALSGYHISPETKRETLVFTDGLTVFSVFVDPDEVIKVPDMQAERGATVAFLSRIRNGNEEHVICVVGEIPIETAKKVAQSLAPI